MTCSVTPISGRAVAGLVFPATSGLGDQVWAAGERVVLSGANVVIVNSLAPNLTFKTDVCLETSDGVLNSPVRHPAWVPGSGPLIQSAESHDRNGTRSVPPSAKPARTQRALTMVKPAKPETRTFSLHWGSGIIEEEVQITTPYHRPTVQLLKFTEGEAAGTYEIRFCHYDHHGRFQRSPLIIDERDVPALREALKRAPTLRRLLAGLVK